MSQIAITVHPAEAPKTAVTIPVTNIFTVEDANVGKRTVGKISFFHDAKEPILVIETRSAIAALISPPVPSPRAMRLSFRDRKNAIADAERQRDTLNILLEAMRLLERVPLDTLDIFGKSLSSDLSDFLGVDDSA